MFEKLRIIEFVPQSVVTCHDAVTGGNGINCRIELATCLNVHEFTSDIDSSNLQIMFTLTLGQAVIEATCFGINQIRSERPCVTTKEGVGEGNVSPEKAHVVEANQEQGKGVHQALGSFGTQSGRIERAEGH